MINNPYHDALLKKLNVEYIHVDAKIDDDRVYMYNSWGSGITGNANQMDWLGAAMSPKTYYSLIKSIEKQTQFNKILKSILDENIS